MVNKSISNTWDKDRYITKESFNRKAFSLKTGHTFHRMSTSSEKDFRNITYATMNMDDFSRYTNQLKNEFGPKTTLKHIKFKAKKEVKIPDMNTVLSSLHQHYDNTGWSGVEKYKGGKAEMVLDKYNSMSGGSWDSDDAKGLISILKGKGFGGIVDEMDAGVIGELPLVLFGGDSFTSKTSSNMGKIATLIAEKGLKEFKGMK